MKRIAVIGSINMDLTCQSDRHPGPGETVSGRDLRFLPGGKGANQAVAAARLGADVTMFGCVGDDAFADVLIDNLSANGVRTDHIRRIAGVSSGIAMITVANDDNSIVVIPGANDHVTPDYLRSVLEPLLRADICLIQNEIPTESVELLIRLAHTQGMTLIYNPAPARAIDPELVAMASFVTPNEHEAALLFPDMPDLETLLRSHPQMIVTLGSRGSAAFLDGKMTVIPARRSAVVDTTGAGDTFNGALAFALAQNRPLGDAIRFANTAAGLSTESYGAQNGMPTLKAVLNELT